MNLLLNILVIITAVVGKDFVFDINKINDLCIKYDSTEFCYSMVKRYIT